MKKMKKCSPSAGRVNSNKIVLQDDPNKSAVEVDSNESTPESTEALNSLNNEVLRGGTNVINLKEGVIPEGTDLLDHLKKAGSEESSSYVDLKTIGNENRDQKYSSPVSI